MNKFTKNDYFLKRCWNLVYWSYSESNSYFHIKLEGIITKEFYVSIPIDANKVYRFGGVVDNMGPNIMGDVEFTIGELEFNYDPEFIIAYENTDRFYDRNLKDFINDDNLIDDDDD